MTNLYKQLLSRFVFFCRAKQAYNQQGKKNTESYLLLFQRIHSFN